MLKSNKVQLILFFGFVIFIPIIVNFLMMFTTPLTIGNYEHWISFFGSYFGSIIGGLFTLLGIRYTLKQADKKEFIESFNSIMKHLEDLNDDLFHVYGLIQCEQRKDVQGAKNENFFILNELEEDMLDSAINVDFQTYINTKSLLKCIKKHYKILQQNESGSHRNENLKEIKYLYDELKKTEKRLEIQLELYMK